MSYQVLARKWRPSNFDEVLGQVHVVRALRNALNLGRIHHAYLFVGTRGVGKTTLARILAKCLNCETGIVAQPCGECSACQQISEGRFVDLIEIDAASRTGVDDMRELLENVCYVPSAGRFKVYLIDEVHMLSTSSFNALLKTLEEPPEHVKFFFATTHPKKLPVTILSRCLQFNLTRLLADEIADYIAKMLKTESVPYEDIALKQIAIAAEGSVRDGLSLLDQAIAYGNGSLKTQEVEAMLSLATQDEVSGLLRCVIGKDAKGLIERIHNMYQKAVDFAGVLGNLIELLHAIAVQQAVSDASPPVQFNVDEVTEFATSMTPEDTQLFYQIALNGKRDLPFLPDARSAFEMTMLRMLSFYPINSTELTNKMIKTASSLSSKRRISKAPLSNQPASMVSTGEGKIPTQSPQLVNNAPTYFPPNKDISNNQRGGSQREKHAKNGDMVDTNAKIQLTSFDSIEGWLELIKKLGLVGVPQEICRNSVFSVQSNNEVTLALDEHMYPTKTPAIEESIRHAICQVTGHDVKVNFKLASSGNETPEQMRQRRKLQRQRDAEDAIDKNVIVQSLKNYFDAKVVPGTTKPIDDAD